VFEEVIFACQPCISGPAKVLHAQPRTLTQLRRQAGFISQAHSLLPDLTALQKMQVAISRALAPSPRLLLADEPTAAFGRDSGSEAVQLFRSLADEQGSAIVMVTHDNKILDLADRIINLEDGRLVNS
jgi:putative ABC transport system ATP-binding protein